MTIRMQLRRKTPTVICPSCKKSNAATYLAEVKNDEAILLFVHRGTPTFQLTVKPNKKAD